MSVYSDWKCGAIDDEEFKFYSAWEARKDKYYEDKMYEERWSDDEEEDEEEDE